MEDGRRRQKKEVRCSAGVGDEGDVLAVGIVQDTMSLINYNNPTYGCES
jgi:hypothetical protein